MVFATASTYRMGTEMTSASTAAAPLWRQPRAQTAMTP